MTGAMGLLDALSLTRDQGRLLVALVLHNALLPLPQHGGPSLLALAFTLPLAHVELVSSVTPNRSVPKDPRPFCRADADE